MFYVHLLINKRGPLAKIWLAAHWEKKLTKAQIFECNLETTVEKIIYPKFAIALRTSGHLLLGVVRIYHRKAKYLLADCSEALTKMKTAFRPGLLDLPVENTEADYQSITLPEEFHDFETPLPDVNAIDVAEHFTLNQSRAEDITLTEDYESNILLCDSNFEILLRDEQNGLDKDILAMEEAHPLSPDLPEHSTAIESDHEDTMVTDVNHLMSETTLLSKEKEGFVLEPVDDTAVTQRKKTKRKRKLLVDVEKELSCTAIYKQLTNCTDILATLDLAPPTKKTMMWKELGGVDRLLSNTTQPVAHPELQKLFEKCFKSHGTNMGGNRIHRVPEIEEMRKEQHTTEMLPVEEPSYLQETTHSETERNIRNDSFIPPWNNRNETTENCGATIQDGAAFSESSKNSLGQEAETEKVEMPKEQTRTRKDSEEIRWGKRTLQLLKTLQHLRRSGMCSFSFQELCQKNNRKEAAVKFYIFLVLRKQLVLELWQHKPFADLTATPGPMFDEIK
ncbi:PREDICTED: double-strand-break repair protein rad21-like protein 1 [Acanthisitta chloris]|uniref:double-strand-break repair protein rad21-like protein 1 n=1 Tax=Acanthisitta chloris TaxID=57068 RepID=UPI0004F0FF3B|nr:PREDICTED: double-strand-break repair protein rad21-like protein 1 [Acanthisitta chloris]